MNQPNPPKIRSINDYIQTIQQDQKATLAGVDPDYRRLVGTLFGGLMGLVYGLVTQYINLWGNLDLPLRQAPFGPLGNALLITAAGGLIGWATARPRGAWRGISVGAVVGALLLLLRAQLLPDAAPLRMESDPVIRWFLHLGAVPVAFILALPLSLALRWVADHEMAQAGRRLFAWKRLRWPLALLALAAFAGSWTRYPADVRADLAAMDALLQAGRAAVAGSAALPAALAPPQVDDFTYHAMGDYTLEWDTSRSLVVSGEGGITAQTGPVSPRTIIARFAEGSADGYSIKCTYAYPTATPRCRSYP